MCWCGTASARSSPSLASTRRWTPRRRLAPPPEEPVTRKTAAVHLREAIEELGPAFIELGQIGRGRGYVSARVHRRAVGRPAGQRPAGAMGARSKRHRGGARRPSPNCSSSEILPRLRLLPWVRCTPALLPAGHGDRQGPAPDVEKTIDTDLAILADWPGWRRAPATGGHGSRRDRPGVLRIATRRARTRVEARNAAVPGQLARKHTSTPQGLLGVHAPGHVEVQDASAASMINSIACAGCGGGGGGLSTTIASP